MRDFLIKMIAQKVGMSTIPKTQKEFFDMVASDSIFKNDLKRAESLGLIRKNETSDDYVINMDKVDSLVKKHLMSLF